jgi:hypothetical protein
MRNNHGADIVHDYETLVGNGDYDGVVICAGKNGDDCNIFRAGAGGTHQWDVAISKRVRDNTWDQGFMIPHAVVDAIYAAKLCRERGMPALAVIPIWSPLPWPLCIYLTNRVTSALKWIGIRICRLKMGIH